MTTPTRLALLALANLPVALTAHAACDAACTGEDNDGYAANPAACPTCSSTWIDCDPADASIHPHASEVVGNGVDENCDGSSMVQRAFISGLANGSTADFTYSSTQAWPTSGAGQGVCWSRHQTRSP